MEELRSKCEGDLLRIMKHSQQTHALCKNVLDGLWRPLCHCREPRFLENRVKIELEPVTIASGEADTGRLPHNHHHHQRYASYPNVNSTIHTQIYHQNRQGTIFERLAPFHEFLGRLNSLGKNVRTDRDYSKDHLIKVAILDSGVYPDKNLFPALTGASFIEDLTSESHWHDFSRHHDGITDQKDESILSHLCRSDTSRPQHAGW